MAPGVFVTGIGMTRFGVRRDDTATDLVGAAVSDALKDAGLGIGDVQAAFYGSTAQGALEGQLMIAGEIALRPLGFARAPVFNVENACATGATALHLAATYVRSGAAGVALAVGVEKMNVGDRANVVRVFDGAVDVTTLDGEPPDHSRFMDLYATAARAHMDTYGTTRRQLAQVAAKNHGHAVHNARAHYRQAMSVEQVLAARTVSEPLTVPMCAPVTDGAAAVIVTDTPTSGAVRLLASAVGTGSSRDPGDYDQHIGRLVAIRAYEEAGVGPQDVDVAEVHDATSFAEILQTELLGLCAFGDGGPAAERGDTTLGGRVPVNPSGGLVSKGHPLGATGLGQIHELVIQLRGVAGARQVAGARVAVAENGGGWLAGEEAVIGVTLLGL